MIMRYLLSKVIYKFHLPSIKNSKIDKRAKICTGTSFYNSSIEKYSFVGPFSVVNNAEIGKFCSIARNVNIGPAEHPLNLLSTSPIFFEGKNCLNRNFMSIPYKPYKKTIIEHDVWIGTNAIIKAGVKISTGAVIAMGAVVTKDVGPYEIWGGVPARLIKKRFSEEKIKNLLNSMWWDLNRNEIESMVLEETKTNECKEVKG